MVTLLTLTTLPHTPDPKLDTQVSVCREFTVLFLSEGPRGRGNNPKNRGVQRDGPLPSPVLGTETVNF